MSRPSFRHFVKNFVDAEHAYAERVRLTVKNNLIKMRTGSNCCGNHGEPGC